MNHLAEIPRRLATWLWRIRHRRGYGIHSPFAFGLVTGVIYERGAYYAYAPLRATRASCRCPLRERDDRLMLRLANASGARTAIVWGCDTGVTLAYLRAGRPSCRFRHCPATDRPEAFAGAVSELGGIVDLLYIDDARHWPDIFRTAIAAAGPQAYFIVRGIHRTRHDLNAWRTLTADSRVRVTFDLYDFGIACFEARFNKENYVINYF